MSSVIDTTGYPAMSVLHGPRAAWTRDHSGRRWGSDATALWESLHVAHWSRRLTATFGVGRPEDITVDQIRQLVPTRAAEHEELDFKGAQYRSNENNDLACDVAALANRSGGLLVLGVEEDRETGTATNAPGVEVTDAGRRKLDSVLMTRIQPYPRYEIFPILDPVEPDHGFFVIAAERPNIAPHAALSDAGRRTSLQYPVRSGTMTRFLAEPEIARAYRDREQGAADRRARLDAVWTEGIGALSSDHAWIAAALVPRVAGLLRFTSDFVSGLASCWPRPHPVDQSGIFVLRTPLVRLGRIIADGSDDPASTVSSWIRYLLFDDGSAFFAIAIGGPTANESDVCEIREEHLSHSILGVLQTVGLLTRDNAGLTGEAYLRCGVRASPGDKVVVQVGSFSESANHPRAPFEFAELAIDIDSLAGPCKELISATAAAGNAIAQSLGSVELRQFRPDGTINFGVWRVAEPEITAWAKQHNLYVSQ